MHQGAQRGDRRFRFRAPIQNLAVVLVAVFFATLTPRLAAAQSFDNGKAVFAALDKVTARIQRLEAKLGDPVHFGTLTVVVRACHSRPPTEPPKTSAFVEVDEKKLNGKADRIFTGWMFAESPGLNALEHPVFDLWLTECANPKNPSVVQAPASQKSNAGSETTQPLPPRRFRPRR